MIRITSYYFSPRLSPLLSGQQKSCFHPLNFDPKKSYGIHIRRRSQKLLAYRDNFRVEEDDNDHNNYQKKKKKREMAGNSDTNAPLIEVEGREKWWNKVLELDEAKEQVLFSLPMILTNSFYYLIPLTSVMFAGQLGQLQLAGATLANSWATVTGFAFVIGLSGALETLCGQGFGAKSFRMLGIYLQASCITSLLFSIIVSVFWFYTEPILIFLRQDPRISQTAALYVKLLIPSIFAFGFLQNILRFLQTQSVVRPLVLFSAIPLVIHVGITYGLVHLTPLGFKGAPIAVSITLWLSFFMLAAYVMFSKEFELTWQGFSVESLLYIFTNLKLAIPSAAMVCVNTEAIAYNVTYGLSASASTRVSNELGAGRPSKAKRAIIVTLKLCGLLAIVIVLVLGFGHNIWAGFFSKSPEIINSFASLTPLLTISIVLDALQGVLSGVARGCGWQHIAVYVNLASFYFVGTTVAGLLAFKANLHVKGLWIGLICGLSCQSATLLLITLRTNWNKLQLSENRVKEDPLLA